MFDKNESPKGKQDPWDGVARFTWKTTGREAETEELRRQLSEDILEKLDNRLFFRETEEDVAFFCFFYQPDIETAVIPLILYQQNMIFINLSKKLKSKNLFLMSTNVKKKWE